MPSPARKRLTDDVMQRVAADTGTELYLAEAAPP